MPLAGICLNAASEYQTFVDEVNDALLSHHLNLSPHGDFNAHIGIDTETWKGVIGRHRVLSLNENGRCLLQLQYGVATDSASCIIVSADLFSDVLDVRVKRGAELSTDHHLAICSLRTSKPVPNRKSRKPIANYRIKWEALEDEEMRKQFESSI